MNGNGNGNGNRNGTTNANVNGIVNELNGPALSAQEEEREERTRPALLSRRKLLASLGMATAAAAATAVMGPVLQIGEANGDSGTLALDNHIFLDSMASLKLYATPIADGIEYAVTSGYHVAGDLGGGLYYLDAADTATPDNGGTVIVSPDGARWKLVHTGIVSIRQFGAKGDDVADDTAAVQAAFACGVRHIYIPSTPAAYKLTSQIDVNDSIVVTGDSVEPYYAIDVNGSNTRGQGSWFHLAHTGVGFHLNPGERSTGIEFTGIGTFRDQTVPTTGPFVPLVCDYDFFVEYAADTKFDNICLLNPYKGIRFKSLTQGRIFINNLVGQPFHTGLFIELSYDICRVHNIHFWPYWSYAQKVWDWQMANTVGVRSHRSDNPFYSNIFTIFHHIGFLIDGDTTNYTTNKLKLVNGDFDIGGNGIVVAAGGRGHTGQYTNITSQGASDYPGANVGFLCQGDSCDLDFVNADFRNFRGSAFRIENGYCRMAIHNLTATDWNLAAAGWPAVYADQYCNVKVTGITRFNGGGGALRYAGTGKISAELAAGRSTSDTDANGDVTVLHGGRAVPSFVDIQLRSAAPIMWAVWNQTDTSFVVRFWWYNGDLITLTNIDFFWECRS